MEIPDELSYTDDHEWVRTEEGTAVVGITAFAVERLGDIVFVELPETGLKLAAGDVFGVVESSKAASDLYSPLTGEVVEANSALEGSPELVNQDPYAGGWMIRLRTDNPAEAASLKDSAGYRAMIAEE
ncbi:MAG: glycine cleavage system protein GcvH [Actinomycetota bacterium]